MSQQDILSSSKFSIWCPVISMCFEDADSNTMVSCPLAYTKEDALRSLIKQLCGLEEIKSFLEDHPDVDEQLILCSHEDDLDVILSKIGYEQTIWYSYILNEHTVDPCEAHPCDGSVVLTRKRKLENDE